MNIRPIVTIIRELNKIVIIPKGDVILTNGSGLSAGEGYFPFNAKRTIDVKPDPYQLVDAKIISVNPKPAVPLTIKISVQVDQFPGENNLELVNGKDQILLQSVMSKNKAKLYCEPRVDVSNSKLHEGIADFENLYAKEIDFVSTGSDRKHVKIQNFFNRHNETNLLKKIGSIDEEELETTLIYEEEENLVDK
ncbi:MAG: hypothetical protein PVH88_25835 [Ignavibacteria bacterium]|jgi:hypothetical protein